MLGPTRTQYFVPQRHRDAVLRAWDALAHCRALHRSPTSRLMLRKAESTAENGEGGSARLGAKAADTLGHGHEIACDGVWVREDDVNALTWVLGEAKKRETRSAVYNEYHNAERYFTSVKGKE